VIPKGLALIVSAKFEDIFSAAPRRAASVPIA
jgi:hypothetical protein